MAKEIYFVTGNSGKFEEVKTYIENNVPEVKLIQFNADLVEIQTSDQKELIIDKALKAWEMIRKPLIVDDAAMYFEKYNKFPGIMSKYVAEGIGFEGLKKLVDDDDKATFILYIAYIDSPENIKLFEGKTSGIIKKPEKFIGHPKLQYSSMFIPNGTDKYYAELRNTKDGEPYLSRIKALKEFINWYKSI
jgi:XTP/dITP diphosphohydrolase